MEEFRKKMYLEGRAHTQNIYFSSFSKEEKMYINTNLLVKKIRLTNKIAVYILLKYSLLHLFDTKRSSCKFSQRCLVLKIQIGSILWYPTKLNTFLSSTNHFAEFLKKNKNKPFYRNQFSS